MFVLTALTVLIVLALTLALVLVPVSVQWYSYPHYYYTTDLTPKSLVFGSLVQTFLLRRRGWLSLDLTANPPLPSFSICV